MNIVQQLRNKGFTAFIYMNSVIMVSLNRPLSISEVETAIENTDGLTFEKVNGIVYITW